MQILSESSATILSSFLTIAGNSPSDVDAIAALQKARLILENAGISFEDCILMSLKKDNTADELSKLKIYVKELEEKVNLLVNDTLPTTVDFYKFKDLLNLVVSLNGGVVHGWQTTLMEASKGTELEIDLPLLQKWRQLEILKGISSVPAKYYEAVSRMKFEQISSEKTHYTEEEKIAFVNAYDDYQKNPAIKYSFIAENLSTELNRRVTENSIKGAFNRIRLYRFVLFHISEMKENALFEGKTAKQLAAIISGKIGRTVSSKLVKAALLTTTKQVW